jgi:hypothetical protein
MAISPALTEKTAPPPSLFSSPLAKLAFQVGNGCICCPDGAVWSFRLALAKHGAASVNEGVPKEHEIETYEIGRACDESGDRPDRGGNGVMRGIVGQNGMVVVKIAARAVLARSNETPLRYA